MRTDIPVDLQHHRYLSYLPNREGLTKLTVDLAARLKQLRAPAPAVKLPPPEPLEFGDEGDRSFSTLD